MSIHFAVGSRVVCINDAFQNSSPKLIPPVRGCVYTLREIVAPHKGPLCCLLEEIRNPIDLWRARDTGEFFEEPIFALARFRPVRETSIDCFTALLEKPPIKQTEDA